MTKVAASSPAATAARTPHTPGIAQNLLADALHSVCFTGTALLNMRLSKPFSVSNPEPSTAQAPPAPFRHVGVVHLIVGGSCAIEVDGGERHALSGGDIVLLPFAAGHRLYGGDGECGDSTSVADLMCAGQVEGLWSLEHGGGGEAVEIISAYIQSPELDGSPVFRSLPSLLIDRTGEDPVSPLIASAAREILLLAHAATPGAGLIAGRLVELLFVNIVRNYTARLPADEKGWFAACNDFIVGRALQSIHLDAARRWRVCDLAREAGTSRSVLTERFNAMIGQPPIEYLARWRIQLAMRRLRSTGDSLAAVAAAVGYESQAAFTRAFKRFVGQAPGRWREVEAAARRRTRMSRPVVA